VTVVLVGIVLAFAIAETALGLVGRKPSFLAYSESRGWRLRPGAEGRYARAWVSIDADGLRGPRVAPAKSADTWRVAVLGDSFVEAIHVPYERRTRDREHRPRCSPAGRRPAAITNAERAARVTTTRRMRIRNVLTLQAIFAYHRRMPWRAIS
jgi:hypothetical protein